MTSAGIWLIYLQIRRFCGLITPSEWLRMRGVWAQSAETGKILWQTPDPQGAFDTFFVFAANGVVYGGSLATQGNDMYALDADTGTILWGFPSGGSVSGGAAIANGSVFWGSGYCGAECLVQGARLTNNNKLYAFGLR